MVKAKIKLLLKPVLIKMDFLERNLEKIRRMYYMVGRYNIKNDDEFNVNSFKKIIAELDSVNQQLEDIKVQADRVLEDAAVLKELIARKLYINVVISNLFNAVGKISKSQSYIHYMIASLNKTMEGKKYPSRYKFFSKLIPPFVVVRKEVEIISVCIKDVIKIIDIEYIFKENLKKYIITNNQLKKGDVILYYDSEEFLKNDFLARLICIAGQTRISHASIVCQVNKNKVKILTGTAMAERVDLFDIYIQKNRFLFVMRPKISKVQLNYLHKVLDIWNYKLKNMVDVVKFAEKKVWTAALIAILHVISVTIFHRILGLQNPFKGGKKYFCSELVDNIFKEIGIYLTARSEVDAVIGPSELFYSPYLEFVGILCNEDEIDLLAKEKLVI